MESCLVFNRDFEPSWENLSLFQFYIFRKPLCRLCIKFLENPVKVFSITIYRVVLQG